MSKEEAAKLAELDKKPGWKTTEFWLALVAQVIGLLLISGAIGDGEVAQYFGMAQMILGKLGYDYTIGKVKPATSQAKAMLMAPVPLALVSAPVDPSLESTPD